MIAPDASAGADRVLVDSSLWVEYYRRDGRGEVRAAVQEVVALDQVGTTAVILIEVLRGALTDASYEALEVDLTTLHWLEVTVDVARRGARIGFDLERAGKRVPSTDLLIAAAAIEHRYNLWHNNGHFEVVAAHSALKHRRFAA
jgi:predicted nucleic acid-binding protein